MLKDLLTVALGGVAFAAIIGTMALALSTETKSHSVNLKSTIQPYTYHHIDIDAKRRLGQRWL